MKDNRYFRLQEVQFDTFILDYPVEIEKGALLLDKQTKAVLLQLRLNILDNNKSVISSVKLNIDVFDDAGEEIPDLIKYNDTFRDINLLGTNSFGEKTPIVLDARVRKVTVRLDRVILLDGRVWHYSGEEFQPPNQQPINTLRTDLIEQVNRDILLLPLINRKWIVNLPQQLDTYWLCTCGRPNKNDIVECCRCGISKIWLFENITDINIQKHLGKHIERIRVIEDERKIEEERRVRALEEKRIRANKLKRNAFLVFTIVALFTVVLYLFVLPYIKYSQASNSLAQKEYENAIAQFQSLGDYRNSNEMANEANYQKATDLLANKKFDEAKTIFTSLGNFRNSKEMLNDANYFVASDLFANNKFDEAIAIFNNLGDFRNSNEIVQNEANYQAASDLLANKKYDEAITIFASLGDFRNSREMVNESNYQYASDLYANKRQDEALLIFNSLGSYKTPKTF